MEQFEELLPPAIHEIAVKAGVTFVNNYMPKLMDPRA